MIWKDSKWVSVCLISYLKSFGVIWDHLESFKSKGYKIIYTIKCNPLKICTVLFWSVGTTDIGHSETLLLLAPMAETEWYLLLGHLRLSRTKEVDMSRYKILSDLEKKVLIDKRLIWTLEKAVWDKVIK